MKPHARTRARERFPGFKAARIVDEVRAAFIEGRVSGVRPAGIFAPSEGVEGLYAWTPDGERVYVLLHGDNGFAVLTTIRAERAGKGGA